MSRARNETTISPEAARKLASYERAQAMHELSEAFRHLIRRHRNNQQSTGMEGGFSEAPAPCR